MVLAPGITEAMFYFQTDVLNFSSDFMGWINVTTSVAGIVGVWTYRVLFADVGIRKFLIYTTCSLSLT